MIVRYVDIGDIVDHNCFSFLVGFQIFHIFDILSFYKKIYTMLYQSIILRTSLLSL